MVIPIITRLLAYHFVICTQKGISFDSEDKWWPDKSKGLDTFLTTLLPKDKPQLIDLDKSTFKQIEFRFEYARWLHRHHFPFPAIGSTTDKIWQSSLDATKPVSSTIFVINEQRDEQRDVTEEESPNLDSGSTSEEV